MMTSPKGAKASRVRGWIVRVGMMRFMGMNLYHSAVQTQTRYTAVREDVHSDMCDRAECLDFLLIIMLMIHLQFLLRQQQRPEHRLRDQRGVSATCHGSRLNGAAVWEVALKVAGIDFNFFDDARMSQRDNAPIVSWFASTTGFPTIAHIHAATWHKQVGCQPEVLVVRGNNIATVFHGN